QGGGRSVRPLRDAHVQHRRVAGAGLPGRSEVHGGAGEAVDTCERGYSAASSVAVLGRDRRRRLRSSAHRLPTSPRNSPGVPGARLRSSPRATGASSEERDRMMRDIPEPDWRLLRQLSPIALERFCRRVLDEVAGLTADDGQSNHARYLALYDMIKERDKEL